VPIHFFDELRKISKTDEGRELPPLFNFADSEIEIAKKYSVYEKLLPVTNSM